MPWSPLSACRRLADAHRICGRVLAAFLAVATLVGCGADRETRKKEFVASGDRFAADAKQREALIEYRNAVQLDPMFGEARVKLAETFEKTGDGPNALREYIRAADLLPNDIALQLKTGSYLITAHRADDALARADAVIKLEAGNVEAHVLRGNALGGLNNFEKALEEMEEALRLDPTRGATYTQVGLVESARGRRAEAEAAFKRAIELAPTWIGGRLALANFYWASGRQTEAAQALEAALAQEPANETANHAMAIFSLATGRIREAEKYLRQLADVTKSHAAQFSLAEYYIATRRPQEAIAILTPLATSPQSDPEARRHLARAYASVGQPEKAHALVDQMLVERPSDAQTTLLKGQLLLSEDRREDALAKVKAAVSAEPSSAEAQFTLGRVYAARGDVAGAETAFREVLKVSPSAAAAQTELSLLQLSSGRTSAALNNAEAAVKNQPDRLDTRLALVRSLLAARQFDRAQRELQPLLTSHPEVAAVQVQSAVLAASRNNVVAARTTFEKALALEPASLEALGGLLALSMNAKDFSAARARVSQHLDKGPVTPGLLLLAARTYGSTGDSVAAEQTLRRAIDMDASLLPAYSMLGQIYLEQGKLELARQEFDNLAQRHSKPAGPLTMSGMIFQAQGNQQQAKLRYERAVTLDPRAAVAANNLAWLYAESGEKLDEAIRLARSASEVLPDSAEVLDTLGWTYYRGGLAGVAVAPLVRSIEKAPKNGETRYHLGLVYAQVGDVVRSRESLLQALALAGDAKWASDAKRVLAELDRAGPRH